MSDFGERNRREVLCSAGPPFLVCTCLLPSHQRSLKKWRSTDFIDRIWFMYVHVYSTFIWCLYIYTCTYIIHMIQWIKFSPHCICSTCGSAIMPLSSPMAKPKDRVSLQISSKRTSFPGKIHQCRPISYWKMWKMGEKWWNNMKLSQFISLSRRVSISKQCFCASVAWTALIMWCFTATPSNRSVRRKARMSRNRVANHSCLKSTSAQGHPCPPKKKAVHRWLHSQISWIPRKSPAFLPRSRSHHGPSDQTWTSGSLSTWYADVATRSFHTMRLESIGSVKYLQNVKPIHSALHPEIHTKLQLYSYIYNTWI